MADTNVPSIQFTPTGIVLPLESDILAGVQNDQDTAFGGNMSRVLSAPQGQLAQSSTAIIGDKNNEIAEIVNQVNPDTASGRWQDAIGRIYFLDRIAASGTVVTGTLTGLANTVIPTGTIAQDSNGFRYSSLADVTIPDSGTVNVDFQCQTTGPVPCPIGALNTIFRAVTGWDSVTNVAAGTEGTNVESRADFEFRRRNSVAANSVNMVQSIQSAVLAVPNVLDAYVIDNPTGATVNKGSTNFPVIAHSVYVAAAGGSAEDIAKAIWSKKSGGCDYNGTTTFTVQDTKGYQQPFPSYVVKWVTPAALPIFFSVQIANDASLPANIESLIKDAIVDAFNGTDGGSRARIGATLFAGRYYAGVAATDANVEIFSILLGSASPGAGTALTVGIDQRPTLDPSDITVDLV